MPSSVLINAYKNMKKCSHQIAQYCVPRSRWWKCARAVPSRERPDEGGRTPPARRRTAGRGQPAPRRQPLHGRWILRARRSADAAAKPLPGRRLRQRRAASSDTWRPIDFCVQPRLRWVADYYIILEVCVIVDHLKNSDLYIKATASLRVQEVHIYALSRNADW